MSNIQPKEMKCVAVEDPVTEFSEMVAVVEKYAPSKDYFRIATSDFSSSNISWLINTNSAEAFIDRGVIAEVKVRFTINSVARPRAELVLNGSRFCLRSNPLNSGLLNLSLKVGNVITSAPVSECLPALERMSQPDGSKYIENGLGAVMFDQYKYWRESQGKSNNPMAPYGGVAFDSAVPRGAQNYTVISNSTTRAVIEYTIYEQLFLSPLINNLKQNASGMTHITQLQLQAQFRSNACQAMFNIYNPDFETNPYLDGSIEIMPQPILHVCQLLDPLKVSPSVTTYPYFDVNRYLTNFTIPSTPQSTTSVTSNVLQLATIPRYCVLYVTRNFNNLGVDETRHFLPITSVSINFNNVQYLTQADQSQLYKMSVANNLQSSFVNMLGNAGTGSNSTTFANRVVETVGSPVVLCFGKDIPISNASEAISVQTKCNLQVTVNVKQNDVLNYEHVASIYDYSFYIMLINDVSLSTYGANSGSISTSLFTPLNVLNARKNSPNVKYSVFNNRPFGAGGSCDMTGRFEHVKQHKANDDELAGSGVCTIDRMYQGAGLSAGGQSGGAKLSKQQLKKMLLE